MGSDVTQDPLLEESYGEGRDLLYDSLDDREALERQIADPAHDPARTLERWRAATSGAVTNEEFSEQAYPLGINRWPPIEGTSWRRWGQWLEERLSQAAAHPETRLDPAALPARYSWRRRRGSRLSEVAAARLADRAIAVHRSALDAWAAAAPEEGGHRLCLLLETAEVVGRIDTLSDATSSRDQEVVSSTATTTVAVRVVRTADAGWSVDGVHPTDPETASGSRLRARWPALASALGGCFGDDPRLFPWRRQRDLLFTEPPAFLDRLAAEGDELLTLDDADLHAAVVALGCFVEPPHLRLWLTWMFWRIRTFDWNPDDLRP